jgi:processing peptidase subunit beta
MGSLTPGTSLGLTILGPTKNIQSITRSDLENYIKTHYTADRMVLVGSGGVEHDQLCKLGDSIFKSLPKGTGNTTSKGLLLPPKAKFTGSDIRIRNDEQKDAHIALAVEGVGWSHPDHMPLLVAQTIIGGWDRSLGNGSHLSSKLAQIVSANQLAQSFSSFNTTYSDTGLFGVYLVSDQVERYHDLLYFTLKEWVRVCLNSTEAEVARAKNQLKTSMLFHLDSSVPVAEEIGRHMLVYGRRISPFEIDRMIEAVDAKTVREVATKYMYDADPAIVAVGPIESVPDYVRLRNNMATLTH